MSPLDLLLHQLTDPWGLAWSDETYDLALARDLVGAEQATFVTALVANGRRGDTRAILTLAHLGAAEAVPFLDEAARSQASWAATARRALVVLGRGAGVVEAIAHDAVHAPTMMARVAAVMALPTIGGATAIAALDQALDDAAYEVRMLAWDGLVAVFGLEPWLRSPDGRRTKSTRLELLRDLLACELPALVRIGVDELRALTRQLATGVSPAALDLAWTANPAPEVSQRIVAAMVDPDAAYPVDEIAALTGIARRWAEAGIAMRLEQAPPDPRAPDALVRLGATWTVPALEEVATSAAISSTMRATLRRSIDALTQR